MVYFIRKIKEKLSLLADQWKNHVQYSPYYADRLGNPAIRRIAFFDPIGKTERSLP